MALFALVIGQFALAEHSVEHVDHGFSQEVIAFDDRHSHHHDHEDENAKQQCPECVLIKSLQTAFYNDVENIVVYSDADNFILPIQSYVIVQLRYTAHSPRAPPATLI